MSQDKVADVTSSKRKGPSVSLQVIVPLLALVAMGSILVFTCAGAAYVAQVIHNWR
jgi:hypothetical protein